MFSEENNENLGGTTDIVTLHKRLEIRPRFSPKPKGTSKNQEVTGCG